ncbi:metallo-beta-lactamase superfamily protein [Anaerospora hongkongensis]|uniref:Metallo-beta-lactamase superfamily protein n=1 Tax=Anaerospora hongkongensis TaxID=244830 RepID=A0A4R1Q200_9FIRM|nr:MBL fold metallo-hydrolase [Anaerospora hongkongensis]TCL39837.1 metallo-beta-lactamase superfamily protein [Anaerospora hongkongensis]
MKYELVFPGFPGRMTSGTLGWGAMVYIEHRSHKIMFDTAGPGKRIQVRQRLAELNIDPNEIDTLILSHFHYDHVYNYDYFPNARILMHKVEADWVSKNSDNYAIPPHFFPAIQKTGRLELVKEDAEFIPGISTLLVPGHTPGGMALVLRDANMPVTVVAGDAVKNMAELATGHVPKAWDVTASAQSIKKIRDIAEIVIPGHDRILRVAEDQIIATTSIHETIIIPAGVADSEKPKNFELVIEQSSLAKQEIH